MENGHHYRHNLTKKSLFHTFLTFFALSYRRNLNDFSKNAKIPPVGGGQICRNGGGQICRASYNKTHLLAAQCHIPRIEPKTENRYIITETAESYFVRCRFLRVLVSATFRKRDFLAILIFLKCRSSSLDLTHAKHSI